jgi:cell division protein ZapA
MSVKELMKMTARNKVEVRIAGKDYTLVGVESDEYIRKVAVYVDKKLNEIMKVNNRLSTSMASVLTAVNVADDFFKAYESEHKLKTELKKHQEEIQQLKDEQKRIKEENSKLSSQNISLQLELAKREAELGEVRNSIQKVTSQKSAFLQS